MPTHTINYTERARLLAERCYRVLRSGDYRPHESHDASDALERAERYLRRHGEDWTFGVEGHLEQGDHEGREMN